MSIAAGTQADMAFLRFFPDLKGGTVFVNGSFIAHEKVARNSRQGEQGNPIGLTGDADTEGGEDIWWQPLLLMETVRQSLLSGTPGRCPFNGWTVDTEPIPDRSQVRCRKQCSIRLMMENAARWSDLAVPDPVCDLPADDPSSTAPIGAPAQ
jgi:hypothetical protein